MNFAVALLDDVELSPGTLSRLTELTGQTPRVVEGPDLISVEEVIAQATGADGLLVSWRTRVPAEVFQRCPQLRYIGLAASAYTDPAACNVDLASAKEHGVVVSTLGQYGDEATAEWVLLRMLSAARGTPHWRGKPVELYGKQLGVIGMGHMGRHVASRASALGMTVVYTGPRHKPDAEAAGFRFLPLSELVATADVVTVHTPKGTIALDQQACAMLRPDALLINTSIGPTIHTTALESWLTSGRAAFACDICVDPAQQHLARGKPNALCDPVVAGNSVEMRQRKSDQLVENLAAFLAGSPIRQAT